MMTLEEKKQLYNEIMRDVLAPMVKKILSEAYTEEQRLEDERRQQRVKQKAIEALHRAGFTQTWGREDNPFMLNVSISNSSLANRVERVLDNAFKPQAGDMSVELNYRLGGTSPYCQIYLPAYNKCAVNEAADNGRKPLVGQQIVFTGKSAYFTGDDMERYLRNYGAKTSHTVDKKTTLIVTGEKPGPNKLDKAEELGIPVISEEAFYRKYNLDPEA